ncbi:hypothetical protein EJB05_20621, partial [Eragrostis curvula]
MTAWLHPTLMETNNILEIHTHESYQLRAAVLSRRAGDAFGKPAGHTISPRSLKFSAKRNEQGQDRDWRRSQHAPKSNTQLRLYG